MRLREADGFGRWLPEDSGIYVAVIDDLEVIYVGSAKNVRRRVDSHKSSPWFRLLGWDVKWLATYTPLQDLADEEVDLIRYYRPIGNIMHNRR